MSVTGKLALVTLVHSPDHISPSTDELAEQIRREVESSSLSPTWIVDMITVLDEFTPTAKTSTSHKANNLAAL